MPSSMSIYAYGMTPKSQRESSPLYLPVSNLPINHKQCRVEILVQGTVQGVGFRPFIYNLATRLKIFGSVINTGAGVIIHAQGEDELLKFFAESIQKEAPPLAVIDSIDLQNLPDDPKHHEFCEFSILSSNSQNIANTAIPPDINLCSDCLRELLDPTNRRYHYPFINCTNCGPRYTIIESIPYDRPKTSMKVFPMCEACSNEYNDPTNRRFHAQPNACPICGPQISFHDRQGTVADTELPIVSTVNALADDSIVAIRGLGGFHLSTNGCSFKAVEKLRKRKNRPDKPLAIMVANLDSAKTLCHIDASQERLLQSFEHPIVLLRRKRQGGLAENIAPGIEELGVMLPYTPLHHLLFAQNNCPDALVMTSGNMSGSPICTINEDAIRRLGHLADYFLLHNREILTRVDDSVVKTVANRPLILRRARGYAPAKLRIKQKLPQILGCGAGLKNTFSLAKGHNVYPSQHIGDLDNLETEDFYQESVQHLKDLYQIEPEAVACDLHPDYPSTRYGMHLGLPVYKVQHHHAHAVAVMAEHGLTEPVLAIVLDGVGLGDDGTLWGGEILQTSLTDFQRLGHLSHLPLPGGDAAATEPWRMGLSALFASFGQDGLTSANLPSPLKHLEEGKVRVISSMLENSFNSPPTSSCGRLFDAIASLLGLRQTISYEGQAAMELEALAKVAKPHRWSEEITHNSHTKYHNSLHYDDGKWEISSTEFVKMVVDGVQKGRNHSQVALDFHLMLIQSVSQLVENVAKETGIQQVVLSGGCMQNSLLLEGFFSLLKSKGLQVFTGNALPINDGAISIGQAIIGGLRHVSCNSNESDSRSG
ncbi:MAG: hydrogenase maturation protein HypF [Desulforhopalus sp.]